MVSSEERSTGVAEHVSHEKQLGGSASRSDLLCQSLPLRLLSNTHALQSVDSTTCLSGTAKLDNFITQLIAAVNNLGVILKRSNMVAVAYILKNLRILENEQTWVESSACI